MSVSFVDDEVLASCSLNGQSNMYLPTRCDQNVAKVTVIISQSDSYLQVGIQVNLYMHRTKSRLTSSLQEYEYGKSSKYELRTIIRHSLHGSIRQPYRRSRACHAER